MLCKRKNQLKEKYLFRYRELQWDNILNQQHITKRHNINAKPNQYIETRIWQASAIYGLAELKSIKLSSNSLFFCFYHIFICAWTMLQYFAVCCFCALVFLIFNFSFHLHLHYQHSWNRFGSFNDFIKVKCWITNCSHFRWRNWKRKFIDCLFSIQIVINECSFANAHAIKRNSCFKQLRCLKEKKFNNLVVHFWITQSSTSNSRLDEIIARFKTDQKYLEHTFLLHDNINCLLISPYHCG